GAADQIAGDAIERRVEARTLLDEAELLAARLEHGHRLRHLVPGAAVLLAHPRAHVHVVAQRLLPLELLVPEGGRDQRLEAALQRLVAVLGSEESVLGDAPVL